jgi:hypothetical protein
MDADSRTLASPRRASTPPAQRPCPECGGQRLPIQLRVSAETPLAIDVRMASIEGMEWEPGWPGLSWALLCTACGAVSLFVHDPREVPTDGANRR